MKPVAAQDLTNNANQCRRALVVLAVSGVMSTAIVTVSGGAPTVVSVCDGRHAISAGVINARHRPGTLRSSSPGGHLAAAIARQPEWFDRAVRAALERQICRNLPEHRSQR